MICTRIYTFYSSTVYRIQYCTIQREYCTCSTAFHQIDQDDEGHVIRRSTKFSEDHAWGSCAVEIHRSHCMVNSRSASIFRSRKALIPLLSWLAHSRFSSISSSLYKAGRVRWTPNPQTTCPVVRSIPRGLCTMTRASGGAKAGQKKDDLSSALASGGVKLPSWMKVERVRCLTDAIKPRDGGNRCVYSTTTSLCYTCVPKILHDLIPSNWQVTR